MRGWAMRMTEIPFLNAMARGSPSVPSADCWIRVPGACGRIAFRIRTGIPRSIAGRIVSGCRTLAPK